MNVKAIIALLMGLVIQLSQVQSCVAASSAVPSGAKASPACCCEGLQSCPCASDRAPDRKPAPLIPAAGDLKFVISKMAGADRLDVPVSSRTTPVVATASHPGARPAYAGVSLAVAFCSFVI